MGFSPSGAVALRLAVGLAAGLALAAPGGSAKADKIKNPTAVFSGLDKITGRIISFEVATEETVQFGALQLTAKICYSRPPTEPPNTTAFVEVDEVTFNNEHRRIFGGWMYASSPGLHGIEHPVYDLWLTECKGGTEVIAEPKEIDPADEALKREAAQDPRRQQQRRTGQPGQIGQGQPGQGQPGQGQGQPGQFTQGQPGQGQFGQPQQQRRDAFQQPPQQRQAPPRQKNFFEQLFGQ